MRLAAPARAVATVITTTAAHVSVATLVPASPLPVPASAFA
jgi:hypothetical protein